MKAHLLAWTCIVAAVAVLTWAYVSLHPEDERWKREFDLRGSATR